MRDRAQVERLLDEWGTGKRSVIVRLESKATNPIASRAAAAVQGRRTTVDPTELLPAGAEAQRRAAGDDPGVRRSLMASHDASSADQVGAARPPTRSKRQLEASARRAVKPIAARTEPTTVFWAARSVLLDMGKDDLASLAREVDEIGGVYPNRRITVPPISLVDSGPGRPGEHPSASWGIVDSGALGAWGAFGARGKGVKVAVLDTGVDPHHPDLAGKVAAFAEFAGDGTVLEDATIRDSGTHGTHVTGTIVGGDASGRFVGMAPEATVLAGMVLPGGGGSDAQILAGIDWALENGAHVINLSLGGLTLGPEAPTSYTAAILTCLEAGVPVVTAIGNEGQQTSGAPGNDLFAFAVGAIDAGSRAAGFSGGRTQVVVDSDFIEPTVLPLAYSKPDLTAPGVAIVSSVPGAGWETQSGTSMAAPHVSGAIAQLLSATGRMRRVPAGQRAFAVQDLLLGAVRELGEAGQDHRFGFGALDVLRAIGEAKRLGF